MAKLKLLAGKNGCSVEWFAKLYQNADNIPTKLDHQTVLYNEGAVINITGDFDVDKLAQRRNRAE